MVNSLANLEDIVVEVKVIKSSLGSFEEGGIMKVTVHKIVEVEESTHTFYHLYRNETLNCR